MATAYSSWSANWKPSGSSTNKQFRTWLTYTTTETMTQMTIKASMGIQLNSAVGATFTSSYLHYKVGSGSEQSKATSSNDKTSFSSGTLTWTWISTQTIVINKTTAAQSVQLIARSTASSASWNDYFTATTTISVPALAKYTITYKANGGTGADQTNTKTYGQSYTTKASTTFSRTNYNFSKWTTAADGTGTSYNDNTAYTNFPNAATTLYAQWTLNYTKPIINNVQVTRGNKTASTNSWNPIVISFSYTPGKLGSTYNNLKYTISVAGTFANDATSPQTSSGTLTNTVSNTSQTLNFQCSENNSYSVTIKLYDDTDTTGITYTTSLSSATFPIDIMGNGGAMGLMTPAIDGQAITMQEPHIILTGTSTTKILKDIAHPVGSCITMSSNTNPSSVLGFGSWTLIHKYFKYHWITTAFNFNSTNTSSGSSLAILNGNIIELRFTWRNKVAISDSDITIGQFDNLTKIGINDGHQVFPIAGADGLDAIGICSLDLSTSPYILKSTDWVTRSGSYSTSVNTYYPAISFTYVVHGPDNMVDSFCDQFVFQRTA